MLKKIKKIKIPLKNKGNRKWIVRDDSEPDEFLELEVIGYDHSHEEYLIKIPESVAGFTISQFHILHYEVSEKFLGQRFNNYNVPGKYSS